MSRYAGRWPELDAGLLSPELDIDSHAERFASTGRVQVRDALRPGVAEALYRELSGHRRWSLAWRSAKGPEKTPLPEFENMTEAEHRQWLAEFMQRAREGFQFSYLSYMMITGYMNGELPDSPLNRVVELLNRDDWLAPMRRIIADPSPRRTNCQATCYRPGDFLALHNDHSDTEIRHAAYVINLGRDWQADHGGLLQFIDDAGDVVETMMPHYNSINLFRTPALHCVSPVAAHATGSRLAITGWLIT